VHRLQDLGAWHITPSRTPREYVRALPVAHPHHDAFRTLSDTFERAWYGHAPLSTSDIDAVFVHLEHLGCRQELAQRARS
jgi:hypothetical protein